MNQNAMYKMYKRELFYGRRPVWVPLVDENGRPIEVATQEDAIRLVAELRKGVYRLRHGEYAAPDYGVLGQNGRIRPIEP